MASACMYTFFEEGTFFLIDEALKVCLLITFAALSLKFQKKIGLKLKVQKGSFIVGPFSSSTKTLFFFATVGF